MPRPKSIRHWPWLSSVCVIALFLLGFARIADSSQESTDITGKKLLKMLHALGEMNQAMDFHKAVDYISGVYSKHFNNGVPPEINTRLHLANVVDVYMSTLDRSLDVAAEPLVIEAIKSAPALIDAQKQFWADAYKAAEAYFAQPSTGNAKKFCMALPEKRRPILVDEGVRLRHLVFDLFFPQVTRFDTPPPDLGKNFSTLERGMDQGDPYAVEIMFRLYYMSDGADAETVCFVLGELILTHPRLFLQKLIGHEENLGEDHFRSVVCMVTELGEIPEAGNDPDKYKECYNERVMRRIKALESLDDPDLRRIRDRCLEILKKKALLVIK